MTEFKLDTASTNNTSSYLEKVGDHMLDVVSDPQFATGALAVVALALVTPFLVLSAFGIISRAPSAFRAVRKAGSDAIDYIWPDAPATAA